jgi:hypothetical protein
MTHIIISMFKLMSFYKILKINNIQRFIIISMALKYIYLYFVFIYKYLKSHSMIRQACIFDIRLKNYGHKTNNTVMGACLNIL